MDFRRIRSDHRDALVLVLIEWQEIVLVLQQHDGFVRRLQRQLLRLRTVGDLLSLLGIDKWVLEQASQKFGPQHARDRAIDHRFGNASFFDVLSEKVKRVGEGQLDVNPGFQRHLGGFLVASDHVMQVLQIGDAEVVGDQDSVESPFLAKNVVEQMLIGVRRNAVDFVVGGHHAAGVTFFGGCFKRLEKILPDYTLRVVARRHVGSALRLSMHGEVLFGGKHVRFIEKRALPLKSTNRRQAELGNQVGIFAIGFFGAPPTRIASQIEHRSEALMRAAGPHFGGNCAVKTSCSNAVSQVEANPMACGNDVPLGEALPCRHSS